MMKSNTKSGYRMTMCPKCRRPKDPKAMVCRRCRINIRQDNYRKIAQLWNEGERAWSIALILGMSEASVATTISRLRRRGWDLDYRNPDAIDNFHNTGG